MRAAMTAIPEIWYRLLLGRLAQIALFATGRAPGFALHDGEDGRPWVIHCDDPGRGAICARGGIYNPFTEAGAAARGTGRNTSCSSDVINSGGASEKDH
jgi:hypothetical protein